MPPWRSAAADLSGLRPRQAVSHELGGLVVEDDQVLDGVDEMEALADEEPEVLGRMSTR